MAVHLTYNSHRLKAYLCYLCCAVLIIFATSCSNDNANQTTSQDIQSNSSDAGSVSFSVQWHTPATDSNPADTLMRSAIEDCNAAGVGYVTCEVYDESNNWIAGGGPWPCNVHGERLERIPAGPNRRFAVLGWDAAPTDGGDIVYHGNTTSSINITPGEIADAGTIDAYPFVPTGLQSTGVYGNRIDLDWDDVDAPGVAGYRIYRDGISVGNSVSSSFNDFNLTPETDYCYTILAFDGFGNESGLSDPFCEITTSISIWYLDYDQDGYGDPDQSTEAQTQPSGYVSNDMDCNDNNTSIHPGAAEVCNSVDDDCDGTTADGADETWLGTSCDGGDTDLCQEGVYQCSGGVQTCSDNTSSNLEICGDNVDNDCDGSIDEGCNILILFLNFFIDITDQAYDGYYRLATYLTEMGFDVSQSNFTPITGDVLTGYDIVVFGGDYDRDITSAEAIVIRQFAENGGGLLLLGDNGMEWSTTLRNDLNRVTAYDGNGSWGIFFEPTMLCDDQDYCTYCATQSDPDGGIDYPNIRPTNAHPAISGVDLFVFNWGQSLDVDPDLATTVAQSNTASWRDRNCEWIENINEYYCIWDMYDENEARGAYPAMAVVEPGQGRVVAIGDNGMWFNAFFDFAVVGTEELAQSVFFYLSGE